MNEITKKKRGRPSGYKASKGMEHAMPRVMLTIDQLTTYKAAAENRGLMFSQWVRSALDNAVLASDVKPEHPIDFDNQ